jgi:hypothetical protein
MFLFLLLLLFLLSAILPHKEEPLSEQALQAGFCLALTLAVWLITWPLSLLLGQRLFGPLYVFVLAPLLVLGLSACLHFSKSGSITIGRAAIGPSSAYRALTLRLLLVLCVKSLGLSIGAELVVLISFEFITILFVFLLRGLGQKYRRQGSATSFAGAPLNLINIGLLALAFSFLAKIDIRALFSH